MSLLNDPIIIESIHKASDELLRRSQNNEKQAMSITSIRETLLREVSILPSDYCPEVLDFIESLKANRQPAIPTSTDDWNEDEYAEWLRQNPPIPIEDDPSITPEHLERLRQQERATNEGKNKVITFDDDEWESFLQEMKHSPKEAKAKAISRAHYLTPKQ